MSLDRPQEGSFDNAKGQYALVVTRWNSDIVELLMAGAVEALKRHGMSDDDITVFYVPGAFEVPLACQKLAATKKYAAIIALGAVIRGDTPHFEYVAGECTKGLSQVMMEHGLPVAFGVLTVDNHQQAMDRTGPKCGNKGEESALAAMEMVSLLKAIG